VQAGADRSRQEQTKHLRDALEADLLCCPEATDGDVEALQVIARAPQITVGQSGSLRHKIVM
jgi:hypothetical protein